MKYCAFSPPTGFTDTLKTVLDAPYLEFQFIFRGIQSSILIQIGLILATWAEKMPMLIECPASVTKDGPIASFSFTLVAFVLLISEGEARTYCF